LGATVGSAVSSLSGLFVGAAVGSYLSLSSPLESSPKSGSFVGGAVDSSVPSASSSPLDPFETPLDPLEPTLD
jgi:hypothetical protein